MNFNLMENALLKIGEPCKSILEAYYIQKKSDAEIAETFGYTMPIMQKHRIQMLYEIKKTIFCSI